MTVARKTEITKETQEHTISTVVNNSCLTETIFKLILLYELEELMLKNGKSHRSGVRAQSDNMDGWVVNNPYWLVESNKLFNIKAGWKRIIDCNTISYRLN